MTSIVEYFASTPKGMEDLLATELAALGAAATRPTVAGVYFKGNPETAYRALLWSRLASRIMLPLGEFDAPDEEALYQGIFKIAWEEHFKVTQTFLVDASVANSKITHERFAAQKIKDAVADRFREVDGRRPSVDRLQPDMRIQARLDKDRLRVSLDLSGAPLHQRGYRREAGPAPLKENLAAAILLRAGWPEIAAGGGSLVDPMCGSGTFLVEALLLAADIAPGLLRNRFGLFSWLHFDTGLWSKTRQEAVERREAGLAAWGSRIRIFGYDRDEGLLNMAFSNLVRAGVKDLVTLDCRAVNEHKPEQSPEGTGLVVTNPPYGERLGELPELTRLYNDLGRMLESCYNGWQASIFTGNVDLLFELGFRSHKRHKLYNGPIACDLLHFQITDQKQMRRNEDGSVRTTNDTLSEAGQMFRNRLVKNFKALRKWARNAGYEAWRVYDADLPDYNAAIDIYGEYAVIQEYRAPASIPLEKTRKRMREILLATPEVLGIPPEHLILKERIRQKGSSQYEKLDNQNRLIPIREGELIFMVNLWDYLDTGLFSDHRPIRAKIRDLARNRRFLNLFAYTGTATVYAAAGGARSTTTVDLSKTYLDWTADNLDRNGLFGRQHYLIQADCMTWLLETTERFDLIFLDPPTFSISKRTDYRFDVQKDHLSLIKAAARLLARGGLLIFSNNYRGFIMDEAGLKRAGLEAVDITASTIPRDYARNTRIHNCWEITHS